MVAALPFNPRKVWDRETSTPPAKSSTSSVSSSSSSAAENAAAVSGDVTTTTAAAADDQWDALLKSSFNALVVEGSKDDAALDGMMLDEALFVDTFAAANGSGDGDDNNFWTSSGSTSNHQGVTMYDMGGDDYRNATNADFIQPGLPSLQPNLDDLGIIDFGGNVFNDHWPDDRTAETTCSQHQQVAGVQQFRSLATAAETPSFGRDGAAATTSPVVVNQQPPAPPVAAAVAYKSHSPKYRVLKQWEPVPPCSSGVTKAGGVNYSVPSSRFVAPPPQQKPTPRRRPDSDGVPAARRRGNDDETKSGSKSNPELVQLLKENGNLSTRRRPQNPGFGSGDPDAKFGMSSSVVVVDGGQTTFGFPSRDDDGGGGEALLKWQLFNHQQMEQQQRHKLLLEQRQRMLDEQRRQIERKLLEQQEMEERRKRTVEQQQQHLKLMEERKRQRLRPGSGKIPPPKVSDVQQQRLLRCLNNNNTDVGSMRPPSSPWAEAAAAAGVQQRPGLKSGFEVLRRLIPSLNTGDPQNDNCKISKAALLHKAGDHLKRLKTERANDLLEVKATRDAIARLKEDVALLQRRLPHGGAVGEEPAAGGRNKVRRMFGRHAAEAATGANWKYWVFAALVGPLADSFERASLGSPRNFEHASRNAMVWIDQSCSLPNLRCVLVDALTKLSLDTAILDDPGAFAQEVVGKAAASLLAEMEEDVETNPGSGNSSKRDNDNNGFEHADARILYN